MTNFSKRTLLKSTGALGFVGAVGGLSSLTPKATAAATDGYKAMVCISLKGGMDHADTVLPYDQANYDKLVALRDGLYGEYNYTSTSSSRHRDNLLKLNPDNAADFDGREHAFPQALEPLHAMFENGDLAIIGNTGPLVEPTNASTYGTVSKPLRLSSHNDQQATWMSLDLEGKGKGWGGLI